MRIICIGFMSFNLTELLTKRIVDKLWLAIFGLIILTILIYYAFFKHESTAPVVPIPPPPASNMTPLPVKETFVASGRGDDNDECKYDPYNLYCKKSSNVASAAFHYGEPRTESHENIQEGFVEGLTLLDFGQFLQFLFDLIEDMIIITLTLPEHIFYFAEGFAFVAGAVIELCFNLIWQSFVVIGDFTETMNDIATCGLTWYKNLPKCGMWYALDMAIYVFVYVVFFIPIAIVRIITFNKVDLNTLYVKLFGVSGAIDSRGRVIKKDGALAVLSNKIQAQTGYGFMHFPDSVVRQCYSCNVIGDSLQLFYDSTLGMVNMVDKPLGLMAKGLPYFWKAFYFDTIFKGHGGDSMHNYESAAANVNKKLGPTPAVVNTTFMDKGNSAYEAIKTGILQAQNATAPPVPTGTAPPNLYSVPAWVAPDSAGISTTSQKYIINAFDSLNQVTPDTEGALSYLTYAMSKDNAPCKSQYTASQAAMRNLKQSKPDVNSAMNELQAAGGNNNFML